MQCPSLSLSLFLIFAVRQASSVYLEEYELAQRRSGKGPLLCNTTTTLRIALLEQQLISMKNKPQDNGKPQGVALRTGNGNIKGETCCLRRKEERH